MSSLLIVFLLTIIFNAFGVDGANPCATFSAPDAAPTGVATTFTATMTDSVCFVMAVDFDDGNITYNTLYNGTNTGKNNVSHTYTEPDDYNVTALVYDDATACNLTFSPVVHVQDIITGFNVTPIGNLIAAETSFIQLAVTSGTDLAYFIDWEDGSAPSPQLVFSATRDASVQPLTVGHVFPSEPASYCVNVTAANKVSVSICDYQATVIKRVANLQLLGNTSLLWPPGFGSWQVVPGNASISYLDIVCLWNFVNLSAVVSTNVSILNSSSTIPMNWTFERKDKGRQVLEVNCSDGRTSQLMTLYVEVDLFNDFLDRLSAYPSTELETVYRNSSFLFVLTVNDLFDDTCIEWDMGDGSPSLLYRGPSGDCIGRIASTAPINATMESPSGPINITHVYSSPGRYTVTARAFYYDAEEVLTANVTVSDWPCAQPNITLIPPPPYTSLVSKQLTIACNVTIACMKSHDLYDVHWVLYGVTGSTQVQLTPAAVIANATSFIIPELSLAAGNYLIVISARPVSDAYDLVNFTRNVTGSLTVDRSPLQVSIAGAPYMQVPFNAPMTLDSFNLTYDPDLLNPRNTDGVTWTWGCKRSNENWPSSAVNIAYRPVNESAGQDPVRGCFGDGPGVIPFQSPTIQLNASYFEESINYTIQLTIKKDVRSANSSITVEVIPYLPAPNITISCVSNCKEKILTSDVMEVSVSCHGNCVSPFGKIQYKWKIYDGGQVMANLSANTTNGLTNASSLSLKGKTFIPGNSYLFTVIAKLPHATPGVDEWPRVANIPPHEGSCNITPTIGMAARDKFQLCCYGWRSGDGGTSNLVFKYLLGPLMAPSTGGGGGVAASNTSDGQPVNITIYYGSGSCSDRIFLSIGNANNSYKNVISPIALDALGDPTPGAEFIVTVMPPSLNSSTEILDYLSKYNSSGGLSALLQGNESAVTAGIISFASVINTINLGSTDESLDFDWNMDSQLPFESTSRSGGTFALDSSDPPSLPMSSDVLEQLRYAREFLLRSISEMSATSPVAISQRCSAIQSLMSDPQQISGSGVEYAGKTLDLMFDGLMNLTTSLKEQLQSIKDMAAVAATMAICSNVNAGNTQTQDDKGSSATFRSSQRLMTVLNRLQTEMKPSDSPIEMNVPRKIFVRIEAQSSSEILNTTISSSFGRISVSELGLNASCLMKSSIHTARNLFMTNESTDVTISPFISLTVSPCAETGGDGSTHQRKKRSTGDDPAAVPAQLDMELAILVRKGEYVDNTTQDSYGMILHVYNLTQPMTAPVFVRVTPIKKRNDTLLVYVKAGSSPTPRDFDYILMTHNGTNNYSVFLNTSVFNSSQVYVGVQSSDGCRNGSDCLNAVKIRLQYYINFQEVAVQRWVETKANWEKGSSEMKAVSLNKVAFKSHLLGGFGAGFVTPVNTIDFNTLFLNFGSKLLQNPCVWVTVIVIIVLYVPFAVISRRLDTKDALRWKILPLLDNFDEDLHQYELHVHTGSVRNAGTKSNVFFRISGTLSDTGVRRMHDGIRQNFGRGEISSFAMKTPDAIGTPLRCQIWHDRSGGKNAAGWFLEKIILVDVETGNWYMFQCNKWLKVDEDGEDSTKRSLMVSRSFVASETSELFRKNISTRLFNDHLWLSVGYRKRKSLFTRAQRLGACLATLFLAMVTSCMFYRSEETPSAGAIHIGIITITATQFYISIICSLIVFPPILIITVIFSKSKPSARRHQNPTEQRTRTGFGVGRFPHGCVYFAWVLVFLSVSVSATFTIFYSISWGPEKSKSWLLSFILSFIESAILIQPIKVVLVAFLVSFVWKNDPEVSEYESQLGKMKTLSESDEEQLLLVASCPWEDEALSAKARRRREMDDKMKTMISEILFYILFLFFILLVVNGQQDSSAFQQNQNLAFMLTDTSLINGTVLNLGFWRWTQNVLLPILYPTRHYNGDPVTSYDKNYLNDMHSWRIGPPRLRQLRVKKERCRNIAHVFRKTRCTNSYGASTEDTDNYGPGWSSSGLPYPADRGTDNLTDFQMSFIYRTSEELDGEPFEGELFTYSGGGYAANLGSTLESASDLVESLRSTRWIDIYTKAVMVEFNILNPGSRLASLAVVLFEYPSIGQVTWSRRIEVIQLYRYTGPAGVVALVAEIACAVFVLIIFVLEARKICRGRIAYFASFWNCLQLLTLVLFFVAVGLYTVRCLWTVKVVEKMMNHRDKLVSFNRVIKLNNYYLLIMGFVAFLTQCQLLHLLRYNQTISVLGQTLFRSASTLLDFGVISSVIFFAFCIGAYLLFFQLEPYATMYDCSLSLIDAFLGKFDFGELVSYYGNAAGYYLLLYLITMVIFVTNILIALINEYLGAVSNNPTLHPRDHEVIDHFFETVKSLVVGKPQTTSPGESGTEKSLKNIQDLSSRIGYLDDVAETMMKSSWDLEKTDSVLLFAIMYQGQKEKRQKERQTSGETLK